MSSILIALAILVAVCYGIYKSCPRLRRKVYDLLKGNDKKC